MCIIHAFKCKYNALLHVCTYLGKLHSIARDQTGPSSRKDKTLSPPIYIKDSRCTLLLKECANMRYLCIMSKYVYVCALLQFSTSTYSTPFRIASFRIEIHISFPVGGDDNTEVNK